jgi:hypothetical protein
MPLQVPAIDTRSYQELLDEVLARIPVHNPEWTNFNRSDPGVTLVELFAFLTESLLYRSNQIPERNRRKFLILLGVGLRPASSASGIVTVMNDRGPPRTVTLDPALEVRAGQVAFHTEAALDVLPVEGAAYVKRPLANPPAALLDYYRQVYASLRGPTPGQGDLQLYETLPLDSLPDGVDLVGQTTDRSLWMALLLRRADPVTEPSRQAIRRELAGRTLNLGLVPAVDDAGVRLSPTGRGRPEPQPQLDVQLPRLAAAGAPTDSGGEATARYRSLDNRSTANVLEQPGIVQVTLPDAGDLGLWDDLDPLEAGVGELPPPLEDPSVAERVVTWLRVKATAGARVGIAWAGLNAVEVAQRAEVAGEVLPDGTGEPDQVVRLARTPVIPGSLRLTISAGGATKQWQRIDDLLDAAPEVPVPDLRQPPGARPAPPAHPDPDVYVLDPESGEIRFGDGMRGRRPPPDAIIRADYAYGSGRAGNVAAGTVTAGPALPPGFKITNPVRTWGGAEAETVEEGERQITRYLQHRDRLVTAADFETIARRAPGVEVGRVEVLPAFSPELAPNAPGDAAGAVTVMVVPRQDPLRPDAPIPDERFLSAVACYLEPRRLVTTELFVVGPSYQELWVSAGVEAAPGQSVAEVREAVRAALLRHLSPLGDSSAPPADAPLPVLADEPDVPASRGWPLGKAVVGLELLAVASRVPGVRLVHAVLLGRRNGPAVDTVELRGLELPRVVELNVHTGEPTQPDQEPAPPALPVPVLPEVC